MSNSFDDFLTISFKIKGYKIRDDTGCEKRNRCGALFFAIIKIRSEIQSFRIP